MSKKRKFEEYLKIVGVVKKSISIQRLNKKYIRENINA